MTSEDCMGIGFHLFKVRQNTLTGEPFSALDICIIHHTLKRLFATGMFFHILAPVHRMRKINLPNV